MIFDQVFLYEDDLADAGYCMSLVRFRVMADCFYIMHRCFIRVDDVIVRVIDTRIFHDFTTNYAIREL